MQHKQISTKYENMLVSNLFMLFTETIDPETWNGQIIIMMTIPISNQKQAIFCAIL